MKKGLILGSLFLGTAILTGCGGTETLSCTQEADAATGKTVTKNKLPKINPFFIISSSYIIIIL